MIPKAQILDLARTQELQPTIVEKDYVLGWLLYGVAANDRLSRWVFKGGTCLKKCFFETYRFSEDLDFTVPEGETFDADSITSGLSQIAAWIEEQAGIRFPADGIEVKGYPNKRGGQSFQAKATYVGPLNLPRRSLQRVKSDLTQDELIADDTDRRPIHHPYSDALEPPPKVRTYSANEILAEKTRALHEREGRARDVYDLVHLSRNFREEIDPNRAADALNKKAAFKGLPEPTVENIAGRVDNDVLRANWDNQLSYQLPVLPPVDSFISDLRDAIAWWLEPALAREPPPQVPTGAAEEPVPRQLFPAAGGGKKGELRGGEDIRLIPGRVGRGYGPIDRIRFAARNHLCARVVYQGASRIVEPYSLRYPQTGNILLYVHELQRGGTPTGKIKAFKVNEIQSASVTDRAFRPRYLVEL